MTWSKSCIASELSRTPKVGTDNPVDATLTTDATFQINNTNLYVPEVTLSINDAKFYENIKQGFKRTILWKKYRSEITTQPKNINLNYLIDQHLEILIDCFYFHSKRVIMILHEICFGEYYMPLVEIKDFNVLIHNKAFFDQPVKNEQELYEKLIEISRNNNYTTGKLSDFSYHQNYYKQIEN